MYCVILFFFFSSRRRHTRYIGDWSSDVCSSDLVTVWYWKAYRTRRGKLSSRYLGKSETVTLARLQTVAQEIGRASCRERVVLSVLEELLYKKQTISNGTLLNHCIIYSIHNKITL